MDQELISGIQWGGWHWVTPGSQVVNIPYYFAKANEFGSYDKGWTAIEQDAYRAALQSWSDVARIDFTEVGTASSAVFIEHSIPGSLFNPPPGFIVLGVHDVPDNPPPAPGFYNFEAPGWDESSANGGLQVGGFGYLTLVHEIGHGLGLAHPHDNGGGSPAWPNVKNLNQDINTVMSYVHGINTKPVQFGADADNYGYVAGPGAFDIKAIQQLYGVRAHNTGDDTYTLPEANEAGTYFSTIWDTGGHDQLVCNGARNAVINLNDATLEATPNGGGAVSKASGIFGGFTIANGVRIEDASGGSGNDRISGNEFANVLSGNDGNDELYGRSGKDWLYGGAGKDRLTGNKQADMLEGGPDRDFFDFNALRHSKPGNARDVITDFQLGLDDIDLRGIDAKVGESGNQKFKWIGKQDFHDKQGELHYVKTVAGVMVEGDVNGDGKADFQILVQNVNALSKGDFLL